MFLLIINISHTFRWLLKRIKHSSKVKWCVSPALPAEDYWEHAPLPSSESKDEQKQGGEAVWPVAPPQISPAYSMPHLSLLTWCSMRKHLQCYLRTGIPFNYVRHWTTRARQQHIRVMERSMHSSISAKINQNDSHWSNSNVATSRLLSSAAKITFKVHKVVVFIAFNRM